MNSYQKFLGAAFQMLVTIVAGVFAGRYLDAYFLRISLGLLFYSR